MSGLLETIFENALLSAVVKVLVAFAILMLNALLLVWFERRVVSFMQNRIGPNRAGPFGVLQTLADGLKLLFKEQITPRKVELGIYLAAPLMAMVPAFLIFLVIPIGAPFYVGDTQVTLAVTDLNIALLFILAMSSLAVYSIVLAGWASGSKYPLLGGVRATAQMISYEAAMGLALVPLILFTGTTSLTEMVEIQSGSFGFLPAWNVVLIPSFLIFFIAGVAETNRAPFDLVEAESEIVGGYHTEYSGFRFALFFLAEYINIFNISAITVTLFLGGWNGPVFEWGPLPWIMPILWFLAKTMALVFVFVWIRATLPRMRYDQLMSFGWKRLIPLSLLWIALSTLAIGVRRMGFPWT
jgi:NADH-quinone oxidoreductase subunit H